jgi:ATP adenylyltransferase
MDRLWAPWRMGYIVNNPQNKTACFLCEVFAQKDDRKAYVLHRATHCYVIMNLYPYNNGHLLIVPNTHVADLDLLPADGFCELMKITQTAVHILKQDMKPGGFNVGINIGKAAGAGLPEHLHIQIVPRWDGDTSFITVFDGARVMPELLDGTYERLKPYFEKLKA